MSFLAKLNIEDEEINVLQCSFDFTQPIDHSGRPHAVPKAGLIRITLESTNSTMLLGWMVSVHEYKNGTITFYRRDVMSSNKILEFREAFCVDYKETFDASNTQAMKTHLTISAREVSVNDVSLINS